MKICWHFGKLRTSAEWETVPYEIEICSTENLLFSKLNQIFWRTYILFLQVYEEKEKMWERELRKIKGLYDNRLRASQQKSSKMEQALTNQTYQVRFAISKKWPWLSMSTMEIVTVNLILVIYILLFSKCLIFCLLFWQITSKRLDSFQNNKL